MANYSYFDLTPTEVEFIKLLSQSGAVTGASLEAKLATVYNGKNYSLPIYETTIDTGVLTLSRLGQMQIVKVNTEGSASTDTITSFEQIETGIWKDGDIVLLSLESAARIVTITYGNNIQLNGASGSTFTLQGSGGYIGLIYDLDSEVWSEIFRSPTASAVVADSIGFTQDSLTIDAVVPGRASGAI